MGAKERYQFKAFLFEDKTFEEIIIREARLILWSYFMRHPMYHPAAATLH